MHRLIHQVVLRGRGLEIPRPMHTVLENLPVVAKIPAKLLLYGRRPEHAPDFARRTPSSRVQ